MNTTHATIPSVVAPPLLGERLVATLALALLVSCVFDVGRVLYYRMRLDYAVSRSARVLARAQLRTDPARGPAAIDLVRALSGVRDLPASSVRVSGAPAEVVVTARYSVPLFSPPLWPVFHGEPLALDAVGSHRAETGPAGCGAHVELASACAQRL